MIDQQQEFRRYLKAVRGEFETSPPGHPSEEDIVEYHRGQLPEVERERVQSHLIRCADCLEILKDVSVFFRSAPESEETTAEAELNRKWEAIWRRAQVKDSSVRAARDERRPGFWRNPRALFALAAGLLVAFAGTGIWALRLRQEQQELVRQLQTEQTVSTERVRALEQETRRWQEQLSALEQAHGSQLAQLRQPDLNAPIYDLLPQASIPRSGRQSEPTRIKVPPATRTFVVILHRDGERDYPDYGVEILDRTGRVVWQGEGLRPTSDGNFVMTLNRTFLPETRYRLRLYGRSGQPSRTVAEYTISLE